ncbi:hypothetical protein HDU97_008652 [Phlyctochytrium planicorne]|nr:hypothetical protein HDU97_008652 [Phlyctochytrium planicorne]
MSDFSELALRAFKLVKEVASEYLESSDSVHLLTLLRAVDSFAQDENIDPNVITRVKEEIYGTFTAMPNATWSERCQHVMKV